MQHIHLLFILAVYSYTASPAPIIGGCSIFPSNMMWNTRVDSLPIHPKSNSYIASISASRALHLDWGTDVNMPSPTYYGIPFNTVAGNTAANWQGIQFTSDGGYASESNCAVGSSQQMFSPCLNSDGSARTDAVLPIPNNVQVESNLVPGYDGNDHHMILIDTDRCYLWEVYNAYKPSGFTTDGAICGWDLNSGQLRPSGWTSADAAGLPVFPLLARQSEAATGVISHAFRFTLRSSLISNGPWVWPARHNTGTGTSPAAPQMGQIFRLKSSFVIPSTWSRQSKAIATAFKQYGMYLADIGSNMYVQGEPNANWDPKIFGELQKLVAGDFEAVCMAPILNAQGFDPNSGLVPSTLASASCSSAAALSELDTSLQSPTSKDSIPTWAITLIVVGSVGFVVLIVVAVILALRSSEKKVETV